MERLVARWPDFKPRFSRFPFGCYVLVEAAKYAKAVGKSGGC